jgi:hypothetical protein
MKNKNAAGTAPGNKDRGPDETKDRDKKDSDASDDGQ